MDAALGFGGNEGAANDPLSLLGLIRHDVGIHVLAGCGAGTQAAAAAGQQADEDAGGRARAGGGALLG